MNCTPTSPYAPNHSERSPTTTATRLVFLKHPDVVTVVRDVANHASLRDALSVNGIDESRWQSFVVALDSLAKSDVIRVH